MKAKVINSWSHEIMWNASMFRVIIIYRFYIKTWRFIIYKPPSLPMLREHDLLKLEYPQLFVKKADDVINYKLNQTFYEEKNCFLKKILEIKF